MHARRQMEDERGEWRSLCILAILGLCALERRPSLLASVWAVCVTGVWVGVCDWCLLECVLGCGLVCSRGALRELLVASTLLGSACS